MADPGMVSIGAARRARARPRPQASGPAAPAQPATPAEQQQPTTSSAAEPPPRKTPRAKPASTEPAAPYFGQRPVVTSTRLYPELRDRYNRLAAELTAAGLEGVSARELLNATLHEGPRDADEARALLARWRAARARL